MSKDIILNGVTYYGINTLHVPLVGGGTAAFVEMADIDPTVTYHVTRNGSDVSFSNHEDNVFSGSLYICNITPAEGYHVRSVVVTMGGVNISSSAVANRLTGAVVSIGAVTGNVVITVTAASGGVLYALANPKECIGSDNVIDTGSSLLASDRDWTIGVDYTLSAYSSKNSGQTTIVYAREQQSVGGTNVNVGMRLDENFYADGTWWAEKGGAAATLFTEFSDADSAVMHDLSYNGQTSQAADEVWRYKLGAAQADALVRKRIMLRHETGSGKMDVYLNGSLIGSTPQQVAFAPVSKRVEFAGCFTGTLHRADIFNAALTPDEIAEWSAQ